MSDSERLEREIEEILGKIDQFPAPESRAKRNRRRVLRHLGAWVAERQAGLARAMSRWSMSQVMLLAFLMILGSFFLRRVNPLFMSWVMWAGVILFISAFAIMMFAGKRGGSVVQQQWRGRTIRYSTGPSLADRVRRWWSGVRSRR